MAEPWVEIGGTVAALRSFAAGRRITVRARPPGPRADREIRPICRHRRARRAMHG